MILNAILNVIYGVFKAFLGLLPDSTGFDPDVISAFNTFFDNFATLNKFFPVEESFQVLTWWIEIEIVLVSVYFIVFLVKYIRGSN